jgi:hypothetical protein
MFYVGVDLGQAQDYTAIAILEQLQPKVLTLGQPVEHEYRVRYLHRPPLGTSYIAIVSQVLELLARAPLSPATPLIVDKTGVGAAVVDLFTARGKRPIAVTITGGDSVNRESPHNLRVPKRELAATLSVIYQNRRLQVQERLELAQTLGVELANFKVKINVATGNESFEAWRENIHDDLVLAVALAVWFAENMHLSGVPAVGPQRIAAVDQASGSHPLHDAPNRGYRPYG